ncbi:glycosyltransferase [Rapidithrix thailandica]|uniref:Glycosyltransferase n=1 Tax=Rapidithrix thailandica TaxID=413964 RepID=A0AAW9SG72_9BACT
MQEYPDIICVAFPTWEGNYAKSTVQLISQLAKRHRVLYVDYEYTWKDVLMGSLGKKEAPWKRITGINKRLRKLSTGYGSDVFVLTPPPVFPVNWVNSSRLYRKGIHFNTYLIRESILHASHIVGLNAPVVLNAFNPFYGLFSLGKLGESKNIYYCYDEISAAQWAGKHGPSLEKDFIRQVDAVITSSGALQKNKKSLNENCHLIPNGVDYQAFNQYCKDPDPHEKKEKVVGYVGSIDDRLDYTLLRQLIGQYPDYQFRFIGRIVEPELIQPLQAFQNVEFTGPVNYTKLPEKVAEFDVCLIPFVRNTFTQSIYPLKINEYLAAGKPVVMSRFSDHLDEFQHVSSICETPEAFCQAVANEIRQDTAQKVKARCKIAQENSWENRAKQFSDIVRQVTYENQLLHQ